MERKKGEGEEPKEGYGPLTKETTLSIIVRVSLSLSLSIYIYIYIYI